MSICLSLADAGIRGGRIVLRQEGRHARQVHRQHRQEGVGVAEALRPGDQAGLHTLPVLRLHHHQDSTRLVPSEQPAEQVLDGDDDALRRGRQCGEFTHLDNSNQCAPQKPWGLLR
jgi:hypothetical protein